MTTRTIGSTLVAVFAFFATIFIGKEWLLSGGGDWPAFVFWTVLCFAAGFALSGKLADSEFDKRFDSEFKKRAMSADDVKAILEKD